MKKSLGSFLLFCSFLYGVDFNLSISSNSGYKNYPLILTFDFIKSKDETNLFFDYKPKLDGFEFIVLQKKDMALDNKLQEKVYIKVTPKVSGDFIFDSNVTLKHSSNDNVKQIISGRDNVNYLQTTDKIIKLPNINLNIKDTFSDLVGDFKIKAKFNNRELIEGEPFAIEFIISGYGDLDVIKSFSIPEITNVKYFADEIKRNFEIKDNRLFSQVSQRFAFVGEKSYTIPKLSFEYFNITKDSLDTIHTDEVNVLLKPNPYKDLIIVEDKKEIDYLSMIKDFLIYLFIFINGFLIGKYLKFNRKVVEKSFIDKIDSAKDTKELFNIVIPYISKHEFSNFLNKVEINLSNNRELKSLKEEAKELCKKFL